MPALEQQFIVDGQWMGGCDTLLYPTDLLQGGYQWSVNCVNRGGVVQTRPGRRKTMSFCGRKAQGLHWCRTLDDRNFLLVAIDGYIYVAAFPFKTWQQIANVHFSATADRIYFCTGEQAYIYAPDNTIQLLPNPVNIVCMQDGVSVPCFWNAMDGTSGPIDQSTTTGIPVSPMRIGTVMLWKDNRLWLAVGNLVYASDLLYPQVFTEDTYLAEQSGFRFPRSVQMLWPNPVQDILVLTDSSMHTLKSSVQDRTQWQTTTGFQSDINTEVGLVAPWCIQSMHGMPWQLTARGVISYDRALTTNLTTIIITADGEMQRSKDLLAPDVTHSCMGTWENVLMVSVPASSLYNRHTWIMDAGIAEKLNTQAGMCWVGIWTGTYPVQFASPIIWGTQHNYELSYSSGYLSLNTGDSPSPMLDDVPPQAYIHLWENFVPNQIDACETNINCSFETKAFVLTNDDYFRFVFAEFMIVNLKGTVPIQVYVTGLAGNYQPLFSTTLRADVGPWGNPTTEAVLYYVVAGQPTTLFETYRRQVRHMRTTEFIIHQSPDATACTEISRLDGVDKAFQIMVQWQGRLGIRQLKFFYDRQLQSPLGVCAVDESTESHIALEATA